MNGAPLLPDHGFPVRVLVPGWIGAASIKWVERITVAEDMLFAPWNTDTYVLSGPTYPPQPPAKGPMLTTSNIKSALELPWDAPLRAGRQVITGRSWSPLGRIATVMYSVDEGQRWQPAQLEDPTQAGPWAQWTFPWEIRPGRYAVRVRATDETGHSQPDHVPWNDQGYLYNAVVAHPITVT